MRGPIRAAAGWLSRSPRIAAALLVVASTLLSVYAVEVALLVRERWVVSAEPQLEGIAPAARARWLTLREAAADAGTPFDPRPRSEIVAELAASQIEAYQPSYGPALISRRLTLEISDEDLLPLGGVSRAPVVFCNRGGGYLIYDNDEHGFRNPLGLYEAGRLEVAIVGDSFANGMCVDDDAHAAARIRSEHPRTLALGVAGFGPLAMLGTLVEYVAPLEPPTVLWFFFEGNDLGDLKREQGHERMMRYLDDGYSQGLLEQQPAIDRALRDFGTEENHRRRPGERRELQELDRRQSWKGALQLRNLALALAPLTQSNPNDRYALDPALLGRTLERARDTVKGWNGTLHFVYLPAIERYLSPSAANPHRAEILALVRDLGIPVTDVHASFEAHPDPSTLFPFGLHGHYNEAGYQLVADTVLESLRAF